MKKIEKLWMRMMQWTSWMKVLTKLFILWVKFIQIRICSSFKLCQQFKEEFNLCLKNSIMNSWKFIVQYVLAYHHLHCKAYVFIKINKSLDFKLSSSDCIKKAWSSFYLIIFIFWMIFLIWFFQSWWLQTLQHIILLSELNFTFDWLYSMILSSQFFQWLKWLKFTIHEKNIMSKQNDLALIIKLFFLSLNNHLSSIISFFHWEFFLSFIDRRKKDIDRAY